MKKDYFQITIPISFLDYIEDGILVFNRKYELVTFNNVAKKIIGNSNLLDTYFLENSRLISTNPDFVKLISNSIKKKRKIKTKSITYNGKNTQKKINISTTNFEEKRNQFFIVFICDVTNLWNKHVLTRRLQSQLKKSYMNLLENLRQLTESIAHEMRNPLVSIGGYANRLLKSINKKDYTNIAKYAKYIEEDTERLNDIIKHADKYSQLNKLNFSKEDISAIFLNTIRSAKKLCKEKQIDFEFSYYEKGNLKIYIDKLKLKEALNSIIKNIIQLADNKSRLIMKIQYNVFDIDIEIQIYTNKISDQDIDYIFNPFYSIDENSFSFDFAAARRVIILHGGIIKARKKNSSCISFDINIPREKRLR